ncbi:MAG: transposase [Planctomycetaceae bacterium]|nr:transposase [Planctomycetaceae bacterium]
MLIPRCKRKNIAHPTDAKLYHKAILKLSRAAKHRNVTRTKRKRRSAIEPIIGRTKSDHRMGRCFLKGLAGDAIDAILSAAGFNLRKLLRGLVAALVFWVSVTLTSRYLQRNRSVWHQVA